jgi:hypothetical protein
MELGHSSFTNLHFGTYCEKNHKKQTLTNLKQQWKQMQKKTPTQI